MASCHMAVAVALSAAAFAAGAPCEGTCQHDDVAMLQAARHAVAGGAEHGAAVAAAQQQRHAAAALLALGQGLVEPGVMHGEEAKQAMERLLRERGLERPEYDSAEVKLPWELGLRPLARCRSLEERQPAAAGREASHDEAQANLDAALDTYCDAGLGDFVEFYVDPNFEATHARLRRADGWMEEAFMTYYAAPTEHEQVSGEEDLLVQSIHHFSEKPIVVVNYGKRVPKSWTPERYPNMVLMHAKKSTAAPGLSFNLNKINCMLFTKIRTGMALDADQFANRGLDAMFARAREETTKDYPYPILPVHWMSRDPESSDMAQKEEWNWIWKSQDAPKQSARWGHCHPTWTFYALPWMARWTSYVLAPTRTSGPAWLKPQGFWSDEPLLNVAMWADNLKKQWCKYDLTCPEDFRLYLGQERWTGIHADSKYYPKGIAKVFFTAHAAKDPEKSYQWLTKLWGASEGEGHNRQVILYDGKWFASGKALAAYDPSLRCII